MGDRGKGEGCAAAESLSDLSATSSLSSTAFATPERQGDDGRSATTGGSVEGEMRPTGREGGSQEGETRPTGREEDSQEGDRGRATGQDDEGTPGPAKNNDLHLNNLSKYKRLEKCGYNSFKARRESDGQIVLLKREILSYPDEDGNGLAPHLVRQCALMRELSPCPYVIQLEDQFFSSGGTLRESFYTVFEFCPRDLAACREEPLRAFLSRDGSAVVSREDPAKLADDLVLRGDGGFEELDVVKGLMFQVLSALSFCHSRRIMHRDVKPQRFRVTTLGRVKLGGFVLGRSFNLPLGALTPEVVTLWYRAPELLLGTNAEARPVYGPGIDVWAAGCLFAELCTKRPLFPSDSEIDTLFRQFRTLGTPNDECWRGCRGLPNFQTAFPTWPLRTDWTQLVPGTDAQAADLLRQMLSYDPGKRISAKRALEHGYFAEITEPIVRAACLLFCWEQNGAFLQLLPRELIRVISTFAVYPGKRWRWATA